MKYFKLLRHDGSVFITNDSYAITKEVINERDLHPEKRYPVVRILRY